MHFPNYTPQIQLKKKNSLRDKKNSELSKLDCIYTYYVHLYSLQAQLKV